jgi:hypothetical protein
MPSKAQRIEALLNNAIEDGMLTVALSTLVANVVEEALLPNALPGSSAEPDREGSGSDLLSDINNARNRVLAARNVHATHCDLWPGAIDTLHAIHNERRQIFTDATVFGMVVREDATIEPGKFRLCAPLVSSGTAPHSVSRADALRIADEELGFVEAAAHNAAPGSHVGQKLESQWHIATRIRERIAALPPSSEADRAASGPDVPVAKSGSEEPAAPVAWGYRYAGDVYTIDRGDSKGAVVAKITELGLKYGGERELVPLYAHPSPASPAAPTPAPRISESELGEWEKQAKLGHDQVALGMHVWDDDDGREVSQIEWEPWCKTVLRLIDAVRSPLPTPATGGTQDANER